MEKIMKDCDIGCNYFTCGSINHVEGCVNYPDSMSESFNKDMSEEIAEKNERIKELENALRNIIATAEECDGWESFPRKTIDEGYDVLANGGDDKKTPTVISEC